MVSILLSHKVVLIHFTEVITIANIHQCCFRLWKLNTKNVCQSNRFSPVKSKFPPSASGLDTNITDPFVLSHDLPLLAVKTSAIKVIPRWPSRLVLWIHLPGVPTFCHHILSIAICQWLWRSDCSGLGIRVLLTVLQHVPAAVCQHCHSNVAGQKPRAVRLWKFREECKRGGGFIFWTHGSRCFENVKRSLVVIRLRDATWFQAWGVQKFRYWWT